MPPLTSTVERTEPENDGHICSDVDEVSTDEQSDDFDPIYNVPNTWIAVSQDHTGMVVRRGPPIHDWHHPMEQKEPGI